MQDKPLILVINPGSTSTKIALFAGEEMRQHTELTHPTHILGKYSSNLAQLDFRLAAVEEALREWQVKPRDLAAVIGRGGPLRPMASGVYQVGQALLDDLSSGKLVDHASILGGLIAYKLATPNERPAFIADPVSVDEFSPLARISGWPELPRISLSHALNIKAVVRRFARERNVGADKLNLVVAHLGGGFSIAAHEKGLQVDVNNANDAGPMSPERVGTLPLGGLLKLATAPGTDAATLKKKFIGKGGMVAHLGTADGREVEKRIQAGDEKAKLVFEAMAYQIAKEIGAMATVMKGKVDGIILTGGLAYQKRLVAWITERVAFIAPVTTYPGQDEMKALAEHALTALRQPDTVKTY